VTDDRALERLQENTEQLEAAAQQPTRVYRIRDLAVRVDTVSTPDEAKVLAGQLQQEVEGLKQVNRSLVHGQPGPNLPAVAPDEALRLLYTGSDTRVEQDVNEIANAGLIVADFSGTDPTHREQRAVQIAELNSLVPDTAAELEQAVTLYANKNQQIIDDQFTLSTSLLLLAIAAAMFVVLVLFRPMARSIHMETSHLEEAERSHRENNERQTFRNDLSKALEVTETEAEVLAAVGRAFETVIPDNKVELLLSDSSGTHLRRAQVHPTMGAARCPVDSPKSCAALRNTQRMVYESSRMLNVCPKLPEHSQAPCSAVCAPVMFNGQTLGVLHAIGADNRPPTQTQTERLSVLAAETGARLGHLQVMALTELQATTDGLTGLFNRRTIEDQARSMLLDEKQFSIAMADLDNFKELNDTYGHETGDRALRLFAKTLRQHLRPDDTASRYGGEEFIVLLPGTSITEAVRALERLQAALAEDVARSAAAPFTVSWGLTDTSSGSTFEEMVAVADAALYSAKRAGKNCIVVDGEAARAAGELPDNLPETGAGSGLRAGEELVEFDLDFLTASESDTPS
jgi:diguanylate cyclase (GGDEF)-like protein